MTAQVSLASRQKSDKKYQMPTARIRHTMIVLFPLGKLKAAKHNKDFCPIQVKHGRVECR